MSHRMHSARGSVSIGRRQPTHEPVKLVLALLGVALAVALVGLAALAIWRLAPRRQPGRLSALQILDRRFAAGEVDGDDYARRRRALEQAP